MLISHDLSNGSLSDTQYAGESGWLRAKPGDPPGLRRAANSNWLNLWAGLGANCAARSGIGRGEGGGDLQLFRKLG